MPLTWIEQLEDSVASEVSAPKAAQIDFGDGGTSDFIFYHHNILTCFSVTFFFPIIRPSMTMTLMSLTTGM
jgi:hypothetical protein